MLEFRLKAYQGFLSKPIPTWGGGGALEDIHGDIYQLSKLDAASPLGPDR